MFLILCWQNVNWSGMMRQVLIFFSYFDVPEILYFNLYFNLYFSCFIDFLPTFTSFFPPLTLTWPTQPSATCHARLMCKFLSFKSMTFCLVLSSHLCSFLEAEDLIHLKKLKLLARNGDSCESAHENLLIPVKMLPEIC